MRRSKFGVRTDRAGKEARTVDNVCFASMKEARRYQELKLLQRAGEIHGLQLQPQFQLEIGGNKICAYRGDFRYLDKSGNEVIEDAKGFRTPEYKLKRKLMLAIHGIAIHEV